MARSVDTNRAGVRLTPTVQGIVSLLIFIHLFFLVVALGANLAPSQLQSRILSRFAFYTRLLNFELTFSPFFLTHGPLQDADQRIEVLPVGKSPEKDEDWIVLPDQGVRGSDRYQRYQRLGRVMATFSQEDEVVSRLAQAVGTHFLQQRGIQPQRIRCRSHLLQDWNVIQSGTAAQRDPHDPSYFQVVYEANLVVSAAGRLSVVRLGQTGEVAQPASRKR